MSDSRSISPSSDELTELLEVEESDGIFTHAWQQLKKRKLRPLNRFASWPSFTPSASWLL